MSECVVFRRWAAAAAVLVAVAAVMTAGIGTAAAGAAAGTCAHPHGPFTIKTIQTSQGSRPEMVDGTGKVFVPTGITVFGLSEPGGQWQSRVNGDIQQIRVMASTWCANTVRIQAAPDDLFSGRNGTVNSAWVKALQDEVTAAQQANLNIVLTAQTENELGAKPGMPTAQTVRYWRYLGKYFAGTMNMFFDIFNEPAAASWNEWFNGDPAEHYIGMNQLVTDIRQAGVHRLLWVEGKTFGDTLNGVAALKFTDSSGLVYDVHHPLPPHNLASWQQDFGDAAKTHPVVIGEWAQYSSKNGECWTDAVAEVPNFLAYLKSLQIGLIAWTLNNPGVLVQHGITSQPTMMNSKYACPSKEHEGAGRQLMKWFHQVNGAGARQP